MELNLFCFMLNTTKLARFERALCDTNPFVCLLARIKLRKKPQVTVGKCSQTASPAQQCLYAAIGGGSRASEA